MTESDVSLWSAILLGRRGAFDELFQRHRSRVLSGALWGTANWSDAEEIVNWVFAEAWRKREQIELVEGSVRPWLLTTAKFMALNSNRAARRSRLLNVRLASEACTADQSSGLWPSGLDAGRATHLQVAVDSLPASERTIVVKRVVEEQPFASVAAELRLPLSTVKSSFYRALGKLEVEITRLSTYSD